MGYKQAADALGLEIEILGIDIEPQNNYPFEFLQADAVGYIKRHGHEFTHLHASPPCQKYSTSTAEYRKEGKQYRDCLTEIKELMYERKIPGVIENVMPSPVRPDIVLSGPMFGLRVIRRRKFELVNWFCMNPCPTRIQGTVRDRTFISVVGSKGTWNCNKKEIQGPPSWHKGSIKETWKFAMGINWMKTYSELAESIPPAYTHWIGLHWFEQFKNSL